MRAAGLALFVLATWCVATPAAADLYRWIDAEGIIHYTADIESIPPAARASAQVLAHPQPRAEPPPSPSAPAVIPATRGAPVTVGVRLNGVALTLIVDTGADRTVISPAALERAGFAGEAGQPVRIVGATGMATASLVTIPLLDVAGARLGPLPVIVHALPADGRPDPVDGLLGRDVLDAFTLTVDTVAGRATLTPR